MAGAPAVGRHAVTSADVTTSVPWGWPAARAYQFYAYPLAVLASHPETLDWVAAHYAHLAYDPEGQRSAVPFCFYLRDHRVSPWLQHGRLPRAVVGWTGKDLHAVLRRALAAGHAVQLFVDEMHIPDRWAHGARSHVHDVLVTSWSPDTGTYVLLGYDRKGVFGTTKIDADGLGQAWCAVPANVPWAQEITTYRLVKDAQPHLPALLAVRAAQAYLAGTDLSNRYHTEGAAMVRYFGIDVYEPLRAYFRAHGQGREELDSRHLTVLREHKDLQATRLDRLADLCGTDELREVALRGRALAAEVAGLRMLTILGALKGCGGMDKNTVGTVLEGLAEVEERERSLLNNVIECAAELVT